MAKRSEPNAREPRVTKWWVELGVGEKVRSKRPPGPAGSQFFQVGNDFEQERARDRLTDNNLKLLHTAAPLEGEWGYVRIGATTYPERELDRIKKMVSLPSYARGVVVDCGNSVRLLVTGTPAGERLLELTLGAAPSFDCWVHNEWVREALFEDAERAIQALCRNIREFLSPEGIARYESIIARA